MSIIKSKLLRCQVLEGSAEGAFGRFLPAPKARERPRGHCVLTYKTLYVPDDWGQGGRDGRRRRHAARRRRRGRSRRAGGTRARSRAPALAPGSRRMVEGRARDERHDGRRGHPVARVPRDPRRGDDRALGGLDPLAAARGRLVGQLLRRARRPLDDGRGLRGAAARRATRPTPRTCAPRPPSSRGAGGIEQARVFTHIWLALFGAWPWDQVPELPPELMLLPAVRCRSASTTSPAGRARPSSRSRSCWPCARRAPLPFRLDELRGAAALAALARAQRDRRARSRSPTGRWRSTGAARCAPLREAGARRRRALDRAPPGGRRLMGRHPAAVGLLADRAAPARLPDRSPADAGRASTGSSASPSRSEHSRRLEACQSPVWDTALAIVALADAGHAGRRSGAACAPPTG